MQTIATLADTLTSVFLMVFSFALLAIAANELSKRIPMRFDKNLPPPDMAQPKRAREPRSWERDNTLN